MRAVRWSRRVARRAIEVGRRTAPWGNHQHFRRMQGEVLAETRARSARAVHPSPPAPAGPVQPELAQYEDLMADVRRRYEGSCADAGARVLVHVPPAALSPAGASLFRNLIAGLRYLGVAAEALTWGEPTVTALERFRPTAFLTSDDPTYREALDWSAIAERRARHGLVVGTTAILESDGAPPVQPRIDWAEDHGVTLFYCFHTSEEVAARYHPYLDRGHDVLSIEMGANPLDYRPVAGLRREAGWVFLGAAHPRKHRRYIDWFGPVLREVPGVLIGPGWVGVPQEAPPDLHAAIYARAQVGLNLHIEEQLMRPTELNERCYNLAVAGVPQVTDDPPLLARRFSPGGFFVADTPAAYLDLVGRAVADPEEASRRALIAQREAFERHTVFERAERLVRALG